jgi:hypothetical protein
LCDKQFEWQEVILWKMPENVWFCRKCCEKFKDDNKYKWINSWIVTEYEPWIELVYEK